MKGRGREILFNLVAFGVTAWVSAGPLKLSEQLSRAAWAEVVQPLPSWFYGGAVGVTGAALLVAVGLAVRKASAEHRGFRLGPMAAVAAVFGHAFVIGSFRPNSYAIEAADRDLHRFADSLQRVADEAGAIPVSPDVLERLATALGPPPYLAQGKRVASYEIALDPSCRGPMLAVEGRRPGTFLVCAATDRKQAYVTAVGLSGNVGSAQIVGPRLALEPAVIPVQVGGARADPSPRAPDSDQHQIR